MFNKRKNFLFDYLGQFLTKTSVLITDSNYYNLALSPIPLSDESSYYYVITYFLYENSSFKQKVLYYKINLYDKANTLINPIKLERMESKALAGISTDYYDYDNMGLSCEYM